VRSEYKQPPAEAMIVGYRPHEPGTGYDYVRRFPWGMALREAEARSQGVDPKPSISLVSLRPGPPRGPCGLLYRIDRHS